eukprot:5057701-Amphidinium_carterae.1
MLMASTWFRVKHERHYCINFYNLEDKLKETNLGVPSGDVWLKGCTGARVQGVTAKFVSHN